MQCPNASELMSLRLDALLTAEQERQLEQHLADCVDCRREWALLLEAMALFEDPEWLPPPPDMTQQVMQRIHRRSLWASALRALSLLVLSASVLLAIGVVPVAALLGTALNSPSLFSAIVGLIVRLWNVMGSIMAAFATLSRALLMSNGSLLVAGTALICVALSVQWIRVVVQPRRLVAK